MTKENITNHFGIFIEWDNGDFICPCDLGIRPNGKHWVEDIWMSDKCAWLTICSGCGWSWFKKRNFPC